MKTVKGLMIPCGLIAGLLFYGCDQESYNPASKYGKTLVDSYKRAAPAGEQANLETIRNAVKAYRATYDRYPEDLDDIKEFLVSSIDLTRYDYNAETGNVSLKKQKP